MGNSFGKLKQVTSTGCNFPLDSSLELSGHALWARACFVGMGLHMFYGVLRRFRRIGLNTERSS